MAEPILIDARGLSCPQPALMTRQTLTRTKNGKVEVLLDSATSRDNVTRIARKEGWLVLEETRPDGFRLILTK
jgi:TusA-related sulfurtransferase